MMRLDKIMILLCGVLGLNVCSCDTSDIVSQPDADGVLAVRLAARGMSDGEATDAESQVHTLMACRFEENGILSEVFEALSPDGNGVCRLRPSQMSGRVCFLANAADAVDAGALHPGVTTLEQFMQWEALADDMTSQGILMTGMLTLSPDLPPLVSLALKRSVARIDLDASFAGVEVQRVVLRDISGTGYVNAQESARVPANAERTDWVRTFEGAPFKNRKSTLCYLAEQGRTSHAVEVEVTIDGAWHRLKTTLPAVERNTVYTLKLYGKGAEARVEVFSEEWENGLSSESALQAEGWIDREASVLPEGVMLSESGDTVYVPYRKTEMQLVLKTEKDVDVRIRGQVNGVTVHLVPQARSAQFVVAVTSSSRLPGSVQEYVYLDLHRQHVQLGRLVLLFQPSPIRVEGIVKFETDSVCDFARYVDGRLATFTLEDGKTMRLELDAAEKPWLRLDKGMQANTYHLEGGWKPNDPEADGRVQTGKLIVSDVDGGNAETYVVKRRNWGLPVVNVNGVWWCKYNLRGHVKDFTSQILVKDDPAARAGLSVADYMKTCSGDEFLAVLGDQYQGGNPEGLKLAYAEGQYYYEGYQSYVDAAHDFGALESTAMAPDGYEVPAYDDFRFFAWGNDCALGYGSNSFNNQLGQRLHYTITERNVFFMGGDYGPVNIYDFDYDGAHWVMFGLGHQWNPSPGSLSKMVILMATSGRPGKTWMLEGYPVGSPQGRATWIKYADNNQQKTRTIRCVKTPVNYIYE